MLQQAFGETALSRSKTWVVSRFKNGRSKRGKFGQMSRQCWSLSLTRRVWCITSFFLPQSQTMNQTGNIIVLQRLRNAVRRKRAQKWSSGTWLLHHDNAPCHATLSVRSFLAKHSIPVDPTRLIHQIWPPATSLSYPGWRAPWRETISRCRGDTTKYDTAVAGHSQTSLPDKHWKVEGLWWLWCWVVL
jgi:hypothetical protein